MKRPEGFDGNARQQPQPAKRPPARGSAPSRPPRPAKSSDARAGDAKVAGTTEPAASRGLRPGAEREPKQSTPRERASKQPQRGARGPNAPVAREPRIRPSRASRPGAQARAELRRAQRERRRAEKAEVRRFTRRARHRRAVLATLAGLVAVLVALVLVAVYSPILALRTITVLGTARIDAAQVQAAVSGQLGTPLALVDFTRLTTELGAFPLIRSYVTETVPPDTLVIRIVERQPVGVVLRNGSYDLVDPAGITIASSPERPAGIPFIDLGDRTIDSTGYRAMVDVLLAMPASLLAQVDTITASTQDDVRLVLVGLGQKVLWGDAEDSALKARVLENLIRVTDPSLAGEFDVSAPLTPVFSPAPEPPPPVTPPAGEETPPEGDDTTAEG